MDDMVYQCSKQNSIYVLNAGYNPTYGDFGSHAAATGSEMNGSNSRTTSGRTCDSIGASCSSVACSLQHKFKTFGTANGSSSAAAAAIPTATATTPAAAAAAASNPVATSMSTAMCSPATAALQKLFNCNVAGDVCQNVSHRNQQQSSHSNSHSSSSSSNNNHNNCPVGSHNNSCLSATASHRCRCDPLESATGTGTGSGSSTRNGTGNGSGVTSAAAAAAAGALPLLGAVANRKKCTNVKSTLIAKKTKFLKFLEEEKWRSSQQLTADDAEASRANSNEAEPQKASTFTFTSTSAAASSFAGHSASKNNNSNMESHNNSQVGLGAGAGVEQQQNKLNNWSMHNDNNNKLANYTGVGNGDGQRKLESYKQANRSSSYELYQEAADILGLSCSLCDNCRCLDCQSGYFDCADDDDESYSEQSLMDEYDEYDYGEEQLLHVASSTPTAGQLELCYAVDCQQNWGEERTGEESTEATLATNCEVAAPLKSEHRLAIDFDLINATSSQVLQNCATFNDLSLLDAEQQVEPFT